MKLGKTPCLYHDAIFPSEPSDYALIECLGPDIPSSAIYKIYPDENENPLQLINWIQNNTRLRVSLNNMYCSPGAFLRIFS